MLSLMDVYGRHSLETAPTQRALRSFASFAKKESAREKRDTLAQSSQSTAKLAKRFLHGIGSLRRVRLLRGRPLMRRRFLEGGAATEDRPYRTTDFSDKLRILS